MRLRVLATVLALAAVVPATAAAAGSAPTGRGTYFHPLSPTRVLDTRNSSPVGVNGTITLDLSSVVPAGAAAVVFNLTATDVTASTFITAWPHGTALPNASDLNVVAGDTRPNHVTVALPADHKVDLHNAFGSVDLIVDLAGYYSPDSGGGFTVAEPTRVLDTRFGPNANSTFTPVGPNATITVDLSPWLPADATAVVFNLTAADVTANTVVTAWPDGSPRPSVSNLNLPPGAIRSNLVTVAVPASRKIDLYNLAGNVDLIGDLDGYYTAGGGDAFFPMSPLRARDTRDSGQLSAAFPDELDLSPLLPATADSVLVNLTGVAPTASTFITAWPAPYAPPNTSNINLAPGEVAANQAVIGLGAEPGSPRQFQYATHSGSADVVFDVAGYFGSRHPASCATTCVYAWGANANGELGTGTTGVGVGSPQFVAENVVTAVAGGDGNSYFLKDDDGQVVSFGGNLSNQLGDNFPATNPPHLALDGVNVLGLNGVTAIAASADSATALRSDGTVWCWGSNSNGKLGAGQDDNGSKPVQVYGLTGVTAIGNASQTGFAVRSDGTVWAWGSLLGSNRQSTNVPAQVPGITGAVAVVGAGSDAFALAGDGSVWMWGLDPGSQTVALTPTKVSGLSGITALAGGGSFGLALRSDGTVWAIGYGKDGELGNGGTATSSTPVQVQGLSGVTAIAAGTNFGLALTSDRTVWSWGADDAGQLGGGSARSVPAQVPGLSGVTRIAAGGKHSYAVTG